MGKINSIVISKATAIAGVSVSEGDVFLVPQEVSEDNARELLRMKRAVEADEKQHKGRLAEYKKKMDGLEEQRQVEREAAEKEAKEKADKAATEAEARAAEIIKAAEEKAGEIIKAAEEKAAEIIKDAEDKSKASGKK